MSDTTFTNGVTLTDAAWCQDLNDLYYRASGLPGTTTNDNATAGRVGEFVESSVTGVAVTTGADANITSISLTAGDWDVHGIVSGTGTSTNTALKVGISTTSATFGGANGKDTVLYALNTSAATGSASIPNLRMSLSGTTTIYLVARIFVANINLDGYISARRVR